VKRASCFKFVSWIVKMLYLIRVHYMFFIIFENSWSPLDLWYGALRHQLMWANLSQRGACLVPFTWWVEWCFTTEDVLGAPFPFWKEECFINEWGKVAERSCAVPCIGANHPLKMYGSISYLLNFMLHFIWLPWLLQLYNHLVKPVMYSFCGVSFMMWNDLWILYWWKYNG
jgi:hypothetical protein